MKLKNVDLNLFVTFEVIYDVGNLTQAAQILNVTQPAVSNALARLRLQVEDPLFVHTGKRMNPTAAAEELIGPVRQALGLLRGSVEKEKVFEPIDSKKTIRLSIGDVGESVLLPRFVEKIRSEAPHIKIHVFQIERRSISKKLAANEIDFAIDIPSTIEDPLRQISLMSDHQVCALSPGHPLASRSKITLEDYLASEHIHVSSRRKGGGVADIELSKIGAVRNNVVRLQHYQAAFALLDQTDLILTTPASLARPFACEIFDLPFDAPNLDLHLYWHKSSESSAENNWVRGKFIEVANDLSLS